MDRNLNERIDLKTTSFYSITEKSQVLPESCKTGTGKPPFKASKGGCLEDLRVSEDINPSEFQQGKGMSVSIRPKVRLETFPNGLPMSVSSKVYETLGFTIRTGRMKRTQRYRIVGPIP